MLITELLKKNATLYGDDIALVSVYSNGLILLMIPLMKHIVLRYWCEFNEKQIRWQFIIRLELGRQ